MAPLCILIRSPRTKSTHEHSGVRIQRRLALLIVTTCDKAIGKYNSLVVLFHTLVALTATHFVCVSYGAIQEQFHQVVLTKDKLEPSSCSFVCLTKEEFKTTCCASCELSRDLCLKAARTHLRNHCYRNVTLWPITPLDSLDRHDCPFHVVSWTITSL